MAQKAPEKLTAPIFGSVCPDVGSAFSFARAEFWRGIPVLVAFKVLSVQDKGDEARRPVIEYLRDLETVARSECECRETVQLIASGRRLLGDKTEIASGNGPFSRT